MAKPVKYLGAGLCVTAVTRRGAIVDRKPFEPGEGSRAQDLVMTFSTSRTTRVSYTGERGPIFRLAFSTGLLALITLGIYRFWGKTRLRRYIWGSTRLDGDAFEYTGTGLEKFLGFLVSVVILAVYLAVVQLVLFALGLRFIVNPRTEAEVLAQLVLIYATFFAVLPLIFYAGYRARRYKLARTRFRGIRFGMIHGAGGYVWRAILLLVVSILTLGLLTPLMTFRLEKYLTDRMFYGDARFVQGGSWTRLYRSMKHIFIGLGLLVLAAVAGAVLATVAHAALAAPVAILLGVVGYVWLIVGMIYFRVHGFAYLTRNKRLGPEIGFDAAPRTGTVIGQYLLGGLMVAIIVGVVAAILGGISFVLFENRLVSGAEPPLALIIAGVVAYLVLLIFAGALTMALITQPVLAHFTSTLTITNLEALSKIRQRQHDKGADAEGFADALDIGGAF